MSDPRNSSNTKLQQIFLQATQAYERAQILSLQVERYWQNGEPQDQQQQPMDGQRRPVTTLDRRKRVKRLLKPAEHVKRSAGSVFEKVGLAHIYGVPLLPTDPVGDNDEKIAQAFSAAWKAYLELRVALLHLANAYLDVENWEEARRVVSLLLNGNDDKQSELYSEAYKCLCASYYRPALRACQVHDWQAAQRELEELLKLDAGYNDACDLLCEAYYSLADKSLREDNMEQAVRYLTFLRALDSNYRDIADWPLLHSYFFWCMGKLHQNPRFFTWHKQNPLLDKYTCLAISPDGRYLAVGSSSGSIRVCDATTGEFRRSLLKHEGEVYCIAFSNDSTLLASGGEDGYVRLWDAETGMEKNSASLRDDIKEVVFLPGTTSLVSMSVSKGLDHNVQIWQIKDLSKREEPDANCIAFHPKKSLSALGLQGGTVAIKDHTGGRTRTYLHKENVTQLAFSLDYRYLCSVSGDDTILLWDVAAKKLHRSYIGYIIAFSPDKRFLASGCQDGSVKLWIPGEEKPHAAFSLPSELVNKTVSKMFFSQDGKLWILVCGKRIMIVNMDTLPSGGVTELPLPLLSCQEHSEVITSIAMTPDGLHLFALGERGTGIAWSPEIDTPTS